jgi:hypothetical protein
MTLDSLANLLERRLQIIADHHLRDQDPEAHLTQLKHVSEAITAAHLALRPQLDARLNHYLTQASYNKALEHLQAQKQNGESAG